jgi:mono/diheme cytochrome c family protein
MTAYRTYTSNKPSFTQPWRWLTTAAFAATVFCAQAGAAGDATFKAKCVGCHGADGGGDTALGKKFKLRDLRSADVQKQSDGALQEFISTGKAPMPAFGKTLEAAQLQELVAYIRSIAAK